MLMGATVSIMLATPLFVAQDGAPDRHDLMIVEETLFDIQGSSAAEQPTSVFLKPPVGISKVNCAAIKTDVFDCTYTVLRKAGGDRLTWSDEARRIVRSDNRWQVQTSTPHSNSKKDAL